MSSVALAAVIVVIAVATALVIRSRTAVDAPTQRSYSAPVQIDPADFIDADTGSTERPDWLVVVFTSHTCHVCADVMAKARVLHSRSVAVYEADFGADRRLHERYDIDAVPTTVICDSAGVVRRSILGPVTATDLWVAVADVRDPSAAREPRHCANDDH